MSERKFCGDCGAPLSHDGICSKMCAVRKNENAYYWDIDLIQKKSMSPGCARVTLIKRPRLTPRTDVEVFIYDKNDNNEDNKNVREYIDEMLKISGLKIDWESDV